MNNRQVHVFRSLVNAGKMKPLSQEFHIYLKKQCLLDNSK